MAIRIDQVGVRVDVRPDLRQQRRCQHLPGSIPGDLIQQRASYCRRAVDPRQGTFIGELQHGRTLPSQRDNAGP